MHANLKNNSALYIGAAFVTLIYLALMIITPLNTLIVVLNGVMIGSGIAIVIAFGGTLVYSIQGLTPYNRVRQMTIGFFLCWLALYLGVFSSVYLRASGVEIPSSPLTATSRYIAVIAAWLQLTAPDFGLGIFHGRDRKILYGSAVVGVIASVFLVYAQSAEILNF